MKFHFRFSLRTFLLLLVLVPAALSIWVKRSLDQRKHVRNLQGLGLQMIYDLEQEHGTGLLDRTRLHIASRIGKDFVSVPVAVKPVRATVYNQDLNILVHLRWLRSVNLYGQPIDDSGLATIAQASSHDLVRAKRNVCHGPGSRGARCLLVTSRTGRELHLR